MAAPKAPECIVLIMAGGSGTRFWPLSTHARPKQYLNLSGDKSLIQNTVDRISPFAANEHIFVCSTASQSALLSEQLPEIAKNKNLILEPAGKNTAPCLLLSTYELLRRGYPPDTVMMVFASDHDISKPDAFHEVLRQAMALARKTEGLVTLGVVPNSPHTGYGYIESGEKVAGNKGAFRVKRFVEKPDRKRAEEFVSAGTFFWNSGMFVWTLKAIAGAFEQWMPKEWAAIQQCKTAAAVENFYQKLESVPIDVAIMEKAKNVFVIPSDIGWSDVGSWNSVFELNAKSPAENVVLQGEVKTVASEGCLIQTGKTTRVALVGVRDLVVIEANGYLLIADRNQDQKVREIAKDFKD